MHPAFNELKLPKCNDVNTYVIGRLTHRIYDIDITLLHLYFKKKRRTSTKYQKKPTNNYHVPCVNTGRMNQLCVFMEFLSGAMNIVPRNK